MTQEANTIQVAEFSPKIKTYRLLFGALILTISFIGIPLLLVWFLGVGQYFGKRYYDNLKCTLTDRHLEFKKGVFFRVEKTIPLENIQDLTAIDNPLLRLLQLRILKIETAGHSNPQGSDMNLIGIIDAMDFKDKVLKQRELLVAKKERNQGSSEPVDDRLYDLLLEMKELLKDIKDK